MLNIDYKKSDTYFGARPATPIEMFIDGDARRKRHHESMMKKSHMYRELCKYLPRQSDRIIVEYPNTYPFGKDIALYVNEHTVQVIKDATIQKITEYLYHERHLPIWSASVTPQDPAQGTPIHHIRTHAKTLYILSLEAMHDVNKALRAINILLGVKDSKSILRLYEPLLYLTEEDLHAQAKG